MEVALNTVAVNVKLLMCSTNQKPNANPLSARMDSAPNAHASQHYLAHAGDAEPVN